MPSRAERTEQLEKQVGAAINRWAALEDSLALLGAHLLRTDLETACTILAPVFNFGTRLKIIDGLAVRELKDRVELPFWKSLKKYIQELSEDRNNFAHSSIVYHAEGPPDAVPDDEVTPMVGPSMMLLITNSIGPKSAKRPLDLAEMKELTYDIEEAGKYLVWLKLHLSGEQIRSELFGRPMQRRRPTRNERRDQAT